MSDPRLAGRCGMYCGTCEVYRASRDSIRLRAELARQHNCRPGDVVCSGCQALHARGWSKDPEWGRNCRIRECIAGKGLRFCYECRSVDGCKVWKQLADAYILLGVDLKANLMQMKEGQTKEWLAEQNAKWRCIHCRRPIIVSSDHASCHHCGKPPHGY